MPTVMKSHRDFRLVNLKGDCIPVTRGQVLTVPDSLYEEAMEAGLEVIERVETVAKEVPAPVEPEVTDEGARTMLEQALMKIIARNDPDDLKKDFTPKVAVVIAELPPECPRPTGTEIQFVFEALQENMDLAD